MFISPDQINEHHFLITINTTKKRKKNQLCIDCMLIIIYIAPNLEIHEQ